MSELLAACHGADPAVEGWPTVSVVVPVRNEGRHLALAVASILEQEYPIEFDVCLAVAPSDDDTDEIVGALVVANRRVSAVANPAGVTPAGLNAAIEVTTGSIVVRVDGHSELSPGYIRRAVETMCRTGAVNVGGRQVPKPKTPFEEAVAAATTSWMGTGGATYRVGGVEGSVDTVYLGVFDRAAGDAVGWFDESLIRNQDYELNIRLRKAGGQVWFDPELWVGYRPRATWKALAKQYFEYGYWKAEVLRIHPDSLRPRQVAPVFVTAAVVGGTAIAGTGRFRWLGVPTAYVTVCAVVARRSTSSRARALALTQVLGAMHLCWGIGVFAAVAHRALARIRASVR